MNMKIVGSIIGVAVAILMVSSVLAPVVTDAAAESDTYVNDGYFTLDKFTSEDTLNVSWNYSTPDLFIVNGEEVEFLGDMDFSVILSKEFAVRQIANGIRLTYYGSGTAFDANATNPNFTLTYTGGSCVASNGVDTKTTETTELYCIANDGDFVMKKTTDGAYLNSDSEFFANGLTFFGTMGLQTVMYGNWMDPTVTYSREGVVASDFTVNYTENETHTDLYVLDSFTFNTTLNDVNKDVIFSYFVVPHEVTADRTEPLDRGAATILVATIPIIIVALMMALIMFRRD